MNKVFALACIALLLIIGDEVSTSAENHTPYRVVMHPDHPKFKLSITRLTACEIKGPPVTKPKIHPELSPNEAR